MVRQRGARRRGPERGADEAARTPARPSAPAVRPAWELYVERLADGRPRIVRFDVEAADEPHHASRHEARLVSLVLPPALVRPEGLPTEAGRAHLDDAEDTLLGALPPDALLVGVRTGDGRRELLLAADEAEPLDEALAAFAAVGAPGLAVAIVDCGGWGFFDREIRPDDAAREWIANRHVLDALRAAGMRLETPRVLEHVFVGDAAGLVALAATLRRHGVATEAQPAETRPERLLVRQSTRVDCETITTATLAFRRLARELGLTYDGWGCPVLVAGR